jgi:PEGA domain
VSLSPPEDPDPLLAYTTEPGGTAAKSEDSLQVRVETLERTLDDSRNQHAALKSETATLVRAVADIRKQLARPSTAEAIAAPVKTLRTQTVAAATGLIIGVSLGVFGWIYLSGGDDVIIASPTTVSAQALTPSTEPVMRPSIEPEAKNAREAPRAPDTPKAPKAPRAPQAPQAPQAPRYVGTLSIDAEPGGDVFLNRASAGHTPLRLTNLRAGSHLIWIERDGYRRFTRVVQVPADRVTRLSAELEPIVSR